MAPFKIKQHDTEPAWSVTLQQDIGGPSQSVVDLTTADSVRFLMRNVASGVLQVDAPATVTNAVGGVVSYPWSPPDTDIMGEYDVEVEVTWAPGSIQTFPNIGYWTVEIVPDLDTAPPTRIMSLSEYKRAINATGNDDDDIHQSALDAATEAVINYCDRDFGAVVVPNLSKTYWYNGSGILNIADADTVHSVTIQGASALPTTAWIAKTEGPPQLLVYTYIELPAIDWRRGTFTDSMGAMGFTYNLDQFLLHGAAQREIQVTVNADFGWATVPKSVKRAVVITAQDLEEITGSSGEEGGLASKSVADVSESFFGASAPGTTRDEALPALARALVDPYARANL